MLDDPKILDVLTRYGDWAHGGRVEEVAAEWDEAFRSWEVEHWLELGCCWPEAAARLDTLSRPYPDWDHLAELIKPYRGSSNRLETERDWMDLADDLGCK